LKNPYHIGDDPALTQTTGWVDAWTSRPSVYAVAAETTQDVAAAINFARDNNLRLVVKGGGHSYLGTSNAPASLLIWTRRINAITLHDDFLPLGCTTPQHAVSVGAGAIWMHTYNEVTTRGGRYVRGGGCGTVGVSPALSRAAALAATRRITGPRRRLCWRRRSSPRTALSGSRTPARTPTFSGRSKAAAVVLSAS
jgi:hypothetical protein